MHRRPLPAIPAVCECIYVIMIVFNSILLQSNDNYSYAPGNIVNIHVLRNHVAKGNPKWMLVPLSQGPCCSMCIPSTHCLLEYAGPTPPHWSGPHRYQLFLFSYMGNLNVDVFNDKDRGAWNVASFIQQNGLCSSLAAGFEFISENDY